MRVDEAQKVLYYVSLFLQYPDNNWLQPVTWKEAVTDITDTVCRQQLATFVNYIQGMSISQLCSSYVETFDNNEQAVLHVTYHLWGDSCERGQALVKLKMQYAAAGYLLDTPELPDYLPAVLEFCAHAKQEYAQPILQEQLPAIAQISNFLAKSNNPYHHVLQACQRAAQFITQ